MQLNCLNLERSEAFFFNTKIRAGGDKKYQELNASLARQIGTLNCRHMAFPIILGVSEPAHSEQELAEPKAENDKGVTYEGKHYTLYEASQQQRKLERAIRKTKRELIVSEQYGDKDDFTAQSIRLRRLREYYNDFSNKCKLTKREDLLSVSGYGRKISGKAVGDAEGYYKHWSKSITYEGLPKNLAGYYEIKYNNKDEYKLLQGYIRATEKGDISPLIGFDLYKNTAKEADNKLIGLTTSTGITIESYTNHFIDRVIGQTSEPHTGMRQGVQIDDVKDALLNHKPLTAPKNMANGDIRQMFGNDKCAVIVSLKDKRIIQTNPRGKK